MSCTSLITGEVGCKEGFEAVRGRIPRATVNFRKEIKKAQKTYTPESVQARLSAPFYLSQGTHYPRILTLKQQAKSAPKHSQVSCNTHSSPHSMLDERTMKIIPMRLSICSVCASSIQHRAGGSTGGGGRGGGGGGAGHAANGHRWRSFKCR